MAVSVPEAIAMNVNLGGPPGDLWISPSSLFMETGMTAIGIVGTAKGFVIGADGRMMLPEESRAMADQAAIDSQTDEAQKIFTIIDRDKTLAYAVTGFVRLGKFHAWDEIRKKIDFLSSVKFDSCKKYMTALCDGLKDDLNQAVANGTMGPLPSGTYETEAGNSWKILDLFTVGYFDGNPSLVISKLFHSDGIHVDCDINSHGPRGSVLSGSELVRRAIYPDPGDAADPRFSLYAKQLTDSSSLQDATEYVKRYIAACSSDLARELDHDKWKIIGGHTHIAKVTPSKGFEWMTPPKDVQNLRR